ncbi:HET-domain-containing protein [Rhizodiscina lignyota]|uniref:HET-domain-containing protein n=1 Tax=Rhizodiscina lignyota TaxID=1504668 RepID=A0A9P4M6T7_9PEZI|nr:HET-domain-containing protein [Rhizodiscina lignyota]
MWPIDRTIGENGAVWSLTAPTALFYSCTLPAPNHIRIPSGPLHLEPFFLERLDNIREEVVKGAKVRAEWDFSRIKGWLDHCDLHHGTACKETENGNIPKFQLLNCATGKPVLGQLDQPYAALSYVWGPSHGIPSEESGPEITQTIKDAMLVTSQLGLQYLWVDRCCIPRNDKRAEQIQLGKMDLIYMRAAVTIVDAYGENASSGLCGVSVPRSPQPRMRIGNFTLTSSFGMPPITIKGSPWNYRGWTYQEGILSPRCLYFTKHEVYLECRRNTFQESIDDPETLMLARALYDMKDDFATLEASVGHTTRVFPSDCLNELKHNPDRISIRMHEYGRRDLSYPADALNAFSGILSRFNHPRFEISSIFGVPILWTSRDWTFEEGFAAGLSWRTMTLHPITGSSFPTWSWCASGGCLRQVQHYYFTGIKCPPGLSFRFETTAGNLVSWSDMRENFDRSDLPFSCELNHMSFLVLSCMRRIPMTTGGQS